ncbi:MAG: hypothetical protein QXZ48_07775 [Zestosphaera sp.]
MLVKQNTGFSLTNLVTSIKNELKETQTRLPLLLDEVVRVADESWNLHFLNEWEEIDASDARSY